MKLGYARVSTEDQSLTVQLEQLKAAGCALIYQEKFSGKSRDREQLTKLLAFVEMPCAECQYHTTACDVCTPRVIVVTKLDRLARSTQDLLSIVERIGKAGASFVSLAEPWADTTSPAGKLIMTVFAGVAQFERERMMERCEAGRARAKRDGVHLGRSAKLTAHQQREARSRLERGERPADIALSYRVHKATIYRLKSR